MKCSKHNDEKITCININPESKGKRLLCIDCYIEAMQSQVPKEHIIRIRDILQNPKLLFSLKEQGYELFHELQDQLNHRIDLHKVIHYYIQKINELKELIQNSVNDLFTWFDQYTKEIELLWEETTQIQRSIWQQISYEENEQLLKKIISTEKLLDEDSSITQELDNMFVLMQIDQNQQIKAQIKGITKQYAKISEPSFINDQLRKNEVAFEQAQSIFIQAHNLITIDVFKIGCRYQFTDKHYQKHFTIFKEQFDSPNGSSLTGIYEAITKDIRLNFELELILTYTNFANIDLTPKLDYPQLIVISDSNAKIRVGYYVPINYKQNSLLFDFDKPYLWKQIKNINTLVKKKINHASNQFEYQIGQRFLSIDCNGQTSFLNKANEYFTSYISPILPPKPEIKQDTHVSRNPLIQNSLSTALDQRNQHIQQPFQSHALIQNQQQIPLAQSIFSQLEARTQQSFLGPMTGNPVPLITGFSSNSPQAIQPRQATVERPSLQQLGMLNPGLQSNSNGQPISLPNPSASNQSQPFQPIQNQQVNIFQPTQDIFTQTSISSKEVKFQANQIQIFKVIPTYN